jgi:hypothetical protein
MGFEHRSTQPVVIRYSDYTIPAPMNPLKKEINLTYI